MKQLLHVMSCPADPPHVLCVCAVDLSQMECGFEIPGQPAITSIQGAQLAIVATTMEGALIPSSRQWAVASLNPRSDAGQMVPLLKAVRVTHCIVYVSYVSSHAIVCGFRARPLQGCHTGVKCVTVWWRGAWHGWRFACGFGQLACQRGF